MRCHPQVNLGLECMNEGLEEDCKQRRDSQKKSSHIRLIGTRKFPASNGHVIARSSHYCHIRELEFYLFPRLLYLI